MARWVRLLEERKENLPGGLVATSALAMAAWFGGSCNHWRCCLLGAKPNKHLITLGSIVIPIVSTVLVGLVQDSYLSLLGALAT